MMPNLKKCSANSESSSRKKPNRLAALLALTLLSATAQADVTPLTWADCLREASQRNPSLAAARAAFRAAEDTYRTAYAGFLPQITGNGSVTRANTATSFDTLGLGRGSVSNQYSFGVRGQQNLFAGFHDTAQLAKRKADLAAARADLAIAQSSLQSDLRAAFVRLLYAQEQTALTKTIAQRRDLNLRLVTLRFDSGRENKGSVLRTSADAHAANADTRQAERSLRVAQRELNRVMGHDLFEAPVATGTFATAGPPEVDVRAAATQTPAFARAQAQAASAQAGTRVSASDFYPSLDANASFTRSGGQWPPDTNRWQTGLTLSIPLFSGGLTFFNLGAAKAEAERARFAARSTTDETAVALEDALASYANAVDNVAVQQDYLESAKVRAEIARGQYANGLISFQDWDLIESDLIAKEKSALTALRDAVLAQAAWDNTRGTSDDVFAGKGSL